MAGLLSSGVSWGEDAQLIRMTEAHYVDGVAGPTGIDRPSPRVISNIVHTQAETLPNHAGATGFVWQWGQFLDHDLDLTQEANPHEHFNIEVPAGDPTFDPHYSGAKSIPLKRSKYDSESGTGTHNPRQQMNQITHFIDASNVYGSNDDRRDALRTKDGSGRLLTNPGNFLPFNVQDLSNAKGPEDRFAHKPLFLAGDIRANEHIALSAMHTLFVREHNRVAEIVGAKNPHLSGDEIYALASAHVGAVMQVITYKEFLPVLLGEGALNAYEGYDPETDPQVSNEFSTVAYRVGHSMLPPTIKRLDEHGQPIPEGNLALRDTFFAPELIIDEGGIEPLLRGLAYQEMQDVDVYVIDEVRNFLFDKPGAQALDLAALNIQRGRDHGIPSYNDLRVALGLAAVTSFTEITSDEEVQYRLEEAYGHVDYIDAWVGGLAEAHVPGALVGKLFHVILKNQFERLRNGDEHWYQHKYSGVELQELEETTLADIIRRNTFIKGEIQDAVFVK